MFWLLKPDEKRQKTTNKCPKWSFSFKLHKTEVRHGIFGALPSQALASPSQTGPNQSLPPPPTPPRLASLRFAYTYAQPLRLAFRKYIYIYIEIYIYILIMYLRLHPISHVAAFQHVSTPSGGNLELARDVGASEAGHLKREILAVDITWWYCRCIYIYICVCVCDTSLWYLNIILERERDLFSIFAYIYIYMCVCVCMYYIYLSLSLSLVICMIIMMIQILHTYAPTMKSMNNPVLIWYDNNRN